MSRHLIYSKKAQKQLKSINPKHAEIILRWLGANIEGCDNPKDHGRPLKGDRKGVWRYRVGDYRILCDIRKERLVVVAVEIVHRQGAYK